MKKCCLSILIIALTILCSACKDDRVTKQGFFFDTVINITVDKKDLSAAEDAFRICSEAEDIFSRTKKGSELSLLNSGESSALSPDMEKVLDFSSTMFRISGGAFDITVAPLIDLWDVKNRTVPPTLKEIERARALTGFEKITLSPFSLGGATIDLGAVAKGYVADLIEKHFREKGIKNAIIDLGGNVHLIGEYTVGIRDPFNPDSLFAKITLKDKSAVTSGSYQRYFEHDGKRYHHIIDPATGNCANGGFSSVTVISPSSMHADALSTAIYILGEKGLSLAERFKDTEVFAIKENGEILTTDSFDESCIFEIIAN